MSMTTELATGDPLSAPITAAPQEHGTAATRWSLPTRIIFRFCVLYFGLYILTTQMYWGFARIVPWVQMPYLRQNTYVQSLTTWIATAWWGFPQPLSTNDRAIPASRSGFAWCCGSGSRRRWWGTGWPSSSRCRCRIPA